MRISKNVDLIKEPFHLNYRRVTLNHEWEIFHAHQGMEFLYVYTGSGQVYVGETTYTIGSGTLLLFQPFQLHRIRMNGNEHIQYVRTVCMFDPMVLDSYLYSLPELRKFYHYLWKAKLAAQVIYNVHDQNEMMVLFEQLASRLKEVREDKRLEEYVIFMIAFLRYLQFCWPQKITPSDYTKSFRPQHDVEKIRHWVENHYKEKFCLKALAADLHLSVSYTCHLFQQVTDCSISKYIFARRMKEACFLLETSDLSVSQIGAEIGFANTSYFCRLFKMQMGMTPHKYRTSLAVLSCGESMEFS